MTREEAATILYKEWQRFLEHNLDYAGISDAYTMAINTLKQEPCEDCISREQAKVAIRDRFKDLPSRVEINTILNELPSVTTQPKIRHWIEDGYYDLPCVCSYCGHEGRYDMKFCPNCGAKMIESEDKE